MTGLLTSPVLGALVLAPLLLMLVRAALREARGERPGGLRMLVAAVLLALFLAQVTVRFAHG